jgi:hypothetical protein
MNPVAPDHPDWPDYMLGVIKAVHLAATQVRPKAGSLWTSRLNGRRGTVRWASSSQVCISFSEHAQHTLGLEDFLRLYQEV